MAAKNINILLNPVRRTAKGDKLVAVHPIPNKEGEVAWYELRFENPQVKVLMPSWWAENYLTDDRFPDGLFEGMALNAGFQPMTDAKGNAVLDANGQPRKAFYCVPA